MICRFSEYTNGTVVRKPLHKFLDYDIIITKEHLTGVYNGKKEKYSKSVL